MKTIYINPARILMAALLSLIVAITTCTPSLAQQWVIANKDNTRPEINDPVEQPAFVTYLSAAKRNGYNEISWSAIADQDTRKFIIEYSTNGIDYLSAGEVLVTGLDRYSLIHTILDNRPMVYRVRAELMNGRFARTAAVFVDGIPVSPVTVYPTVITGNTININTEWPIERIELYSSAGQRVFAKDVNGQNHHIPVVIPALGKGLYFLQVRGNGWKTTEKVVIG